MASSEFTDNDYFLVVDDGSARLLSRPTFQAWMRDNVQGEQGIQGIAGKDFDTILYQPSPIDGVNYKRAILNITFSLEICEEFTVNTIKRVNITGDLANVDDVNIDIDYNI